MLVGPAVDQGLHRGLPDGSVRVGNGAVGEQGAGVLVGSAVDQGLHRRPPDGSVRVGSGAVGEQGAGVLLGPALDQGLAAAQRCKMNSGPVSWLSAVVTGERPLGPGAPDRRSCPARRVYAAQNGHRPSCGESAQVEDGHACEVDRGGQQPEVGIDAGGDSSATGNPTCMYVNPVGTHPCSRSFATASMVSSGRAGS